MIELIHRDCLEHLKTIPDNSVDLIVTDPPYNIASKSKRTGQKNKIVSTMEAWGTWDTFKPEEYDKFFIKYLTECYRILSRGGSIYCFSARKDSGYFIRKAEEIGFKYLNILAIIKINPLPHFTKTNWRSAFELCFYGCKGDKPKTFNFIGQRSMINKYNYTIGKKDTDHPAEKPLDFIELLIKVNSNEGDTVFDGFMGSGTTGVAAKKLNRKFIGCELDEKYFNIAKERINKTKVQHTLEKFDKTLINWGQ